MFFTAEAMLERRGLVFSSHRAVISAFGQNFAKTNDVEPRFHQAMLGAFSQRQLGDYGIDTGLQATDIASLMTNAQDFLSTARQWLAEHPAD